MIDVNNSSKPERSHAYARNISISRCFYRLVGNLVGSAIQAHMVMVCSELAKVGSQANARINRINKITLGIIFCRKILSKTCQNKKKAK